MPRFYVDIALAVGNNYSLSDDVLRHINVLRLRLNAAIILFNGNGNHYHARISELNKRAVAVSIESEEVADNESNLQITLLPSILASDKFDLVIQKAVELGVTKIIPIYTQHTQRFNSAKEGVRRSHWQRIVIAASEQCGRARLAKVEAPVELMQVLPRLQEEQKFILSPHHANSVLDGKTPVNVALLVGPEGGFSPEEVEMAHKHGFKSIVLGKRILRAETAAIAGISFLHTKFGDF